MVEDQNEITRKRPLNEANDEHKNKRSNIGTGKPLLKLLVPNFIAGKLIGKGGSNINELQGSYNASIQVSPNKEFYPGTDDRIVIISADGDQIINFINYVIEEVFEEPDSERKPSSSRQDVKLVVTNVAAGLVIGKGGSTIKSIQEQSKARINISKRDESVSGERLLVISGEVEERVAACTEIIRKMADEPDKMSNSNIKYSSFAVDKSLSLSQGSHPLYNNLQANNASFLLNGLPNNFAQTIGGLPNNYESLNYQPKSKVKTRFQVEMEIPDSMVGAVLGKQGQTVGEFSRASGAKFQFSPKNEFAPGTTDRILTITGSTASAIQNAYKLIDQKVAQVELEFGGNVRRS